MQSEPIRFHEIKCPHCGAAVSSGKNQNPDFYRCPHCDHVFQILGKPRAKSLREITRIFPFEKTEQEFADFFWQKMNERCFPNFIRDFYAKAQFGNIRKFRVATYFFPEKLLGKFSLSISDAQGNTRVFDDRECFCKLAATVAATDENSLPAGLGKCLSNLRYNAEKVKFFSAEKYRDDSCEIYEATLPEDFIWETEIYPKIEHTKSELRENILHELDVPAGNTVEIGEAKFSPRLPEGIKIAYVSLYKIEFSLGKNNYCFVADGACRASAGALPEDPLKRRQERALADKKRVKETLARRKNEQFSCFGCLVIILVIAFVALVFWGRS